MFPVRRGDTIRRILDQGATGLRNVPGDPGVPRRRPGFRGTPERCSLYGKPSEQHHTEDKKAAA